MTAAPKTRPLISGETTGQHEFGKRMFRLECAGVCADEARANERYAAGLIHRVAGLSRRAAAHLSREDWAQAVSWLLQALIGPVRPQS